MTAVGVIGVMSFDAGNFLEAALISCREGGALTGTITNDRSEFRLRILRVSGLVD
jgi:hypothetical protein